jgi:hypothetical protein
VRRNDGPTTHNLPARCTGLSGRGLDLQPERAHLIFIRSRLRRRTHRNPERNAKRQSQSMDHAVIGRRACLIA